MDLPLVSIAAINYNNSATVIETLESIRTQTYPNIELIIVDDCSTDNCLELITEWLSCYDGKYKLIRHEINKGVCATYNSGLNNASGKYFAAIDTDDIMLPEKTELQVNILEGSVPNVAGVYSDAYRIDMDGSCIGGMFIQKHRQFSEIPTGNIYNTLLQGNYIPCMTFLFKKEIFEDIGGYDERLVYEDYDMWLRIARKHEIVFSEYVSAKYRVRPGSLTFTIAQKEWIYTDVSIYLKHVGAALPMPRLRSLALDAYCINDEDTMPLINELANKTCYWYFKIAYLLWKFRISANVGRTVLSAEEKLGDIMFPESIVDEPAEVKLFIEHICTALPPAVLKEIANDTYVNRNESRMSLIQGLADITGARYFRTIYLLCHFRISEVFGKVVLAKEQEHVDSTLSDRLREKDGLQIRDFVEQLNTALTLDNLKTIALETYKFDVPGKMEFFTELALKTNIKYFRTACLLCEFKISPLIGEKLLVNKKEYIGGAINTEMQKRSMEEVKAFASQMCVALSKDTIKDIARDAYFNDIEDAKPLIEALFEKTKTEYLEAIALFWKHKVQPSHSKRLLSKIEQGNGQSSLGSRISIYKEIAKIKIIPASYAVE